MPELREFDGLLVSTPYDPKDLRQLFGAYFHQDWMLDDPSPEAVVERYLAGTTRGTVAAHREALLTARNTGLRPVLVAAGTYYLPASDAELAAFIEMVLARMNAFLGSPRDGSS